MRMNKWVIRGILTSSLITLFATGRSFGSDVPAVPSQIVLKAADDQPEDYPTTLALKYMGKLLD